MKFEVRDPVIIGSVRDWAGVGLSSAEGYETACTVPVNRVCLCYSVGRVAIVSRNVVGALTMYLQGLIVPVNKILLYTVTNKLIFSDNPPPPPLHSPERNRIRIQASKFAFAVTYRSVDKVEPLISLVSSYVIFN